MNNDDGVPDVTPGGSPGDRLPIHSLFDDGMYWYHPHVRDDYTVEMGLYGNMWVTQRGRRGMVDRNFRFHR